MTETMLHPDTRDIDIDEVFPHAPETIWKALTTGALMARWVMVWLRGELVLPPNVGDPLELPLYSAVIECDPTASAGEQVAVFPDSAVVQIVVMPSRKVTEPTPMPASRFCAQSQKFLRPGLQTFREPGMISGK